ncbi:hypothetical protein [Actinoplanes sp. GCM10030250]|uniref:hypothetical protein n=1 Tax=Actinoplanes sp. GCM10030250 TaxID=3273376 RepID=UPI00360CEC31
MLTMTLFLTGLLVAVAAMIYSGRKAGRDNRRARHTNAGFLPGTGAAHYGSSDSGSSCDNGSSSSGWGGWGGGDGGGGGGGGGDGGGGGGSC